MRNNNDPKANTLTQSEYDYFFNKVKAGIPRRDFISALGAMGAGVAASSTLFGNLTDALAATPRRGGRIVVAGDQHGPNDTLDPVKFTSSIDYFRGRMFYGSLTRLTDKLTWEPELAEEVLANDNATQWTFKLRRGVTFHDGKTFDADDVIYTMNRHLGKDSVSSAKSLVNMITGWEKVNQYEVRANLSSPNADLPIALATFHFKIVQNGTEDFTRGIGTGPFKLKTFKPGVRCIGVRNENYWAEGAYLDELENYGIGDPAARLNAFLAGDVDIMENVNPKSAEVIKATPGRNLWQVKANRYVNLALRHDLPESGNPDLWRCLQHLQDRRRLVQGTLKGYGEEANDQPIGPAYPDYSPAIPQRMLDPEKAAFHFKKSGLGNTKVTIRTAEVGPGAVDMCLFVQREAKKIGMNLEVKQVSADGYWGAVWNKAPIAAAVWNMRPTANLMMSLAFESTAAWNEARWNNPQFDTLLREARSVTDPAKRKSVYHDLQLMIHEGNGQSIPCFNHILDANAAYVKGLTYVPTVTSGGAECPPTLWRADA